MGRERREPPQGLNREVQACRWMRQPPPRRAGRPAAVCRGLLAAGLVLAAGLSWAGPAAPGPRARSASDLLQATLHRAGVDPGVLSSALAPGPGDPAPALAFPDSFRKDPVAGMAALQAFEASVSGGPARRAGPRQVPAAAALRRSLDLAYGHDRWPAPARADAARPPRAIDWPAGLPRDLRAAIQDVLRAIGQAEAQRARAFAAWPATVSTGDLWRRFSPAAVAQGDAARDSAVSTMPSTQALVDAVDHPALALGLLDLTSAVDRLQRRLLAAGHRPWRQSMWRFDTPWGPVVVDTTGHANTYRGRQPTLLIDTGGDDTYAFDEGRRPGTTVLLDLKGNDRYVAQAPDRDPSCATLGYAVLWDAGGDDLHQGSWQTQAAALFGAAALIDEAGDDRYEARGQAQGFALGGVALLVDVEGRDRYDALTQSQASAGPGGLALLLDMAGDDRYRLAGGPLVLPSAQLRDRNASLGQGAAFGLRPLPGRDEPTAPGGLALLVDRLGDDRYEAQVFAQGAGYERGMGVLLDGGGSDQMEAAWYAMAAAAHRGVGVLVARGGGRDSYAASHATSLGAAHDGAAAVFIGGTGADRYSLGTLGLGAAHDGGGALFLDRGGDDSYEHLLRPCRAFGIGEHSGERDDRGPPPPGDIGPPAGSRQATPAGPTGARPPVNAGLFFDLSGTDLYPPACRGPGNSRRWPAAAGADSSQGWDTDTHRQSGSPRRPGRHDDRHAP